MPVLTGIDILGIQRYVFASNRLRDVLAASWMVEQIMTRGSGSLLRWKMADDRVLLAAGGNAILQFDDRPAAVEWTTQYTRWLHEEVPGLEVIIRHCDYEPGSLARGIRALMVELAVGKFERVPSAPQLGLSVTASCTVTGLPATAADKHGGGPLSTMIERLRRDPTQTAAKERWEQFLPGQQHGSEGSGPRNAFPEDLDRMGRTRGDTSLVGVVHVDGNGVGKAIAGWLERCLETQVPDADVRSQYRAWSDAIANLGGTVLRAVTNRVAARIAERDKQYFLRGTPRELEFRLEVGDGIVQLPLRPILLGGDDLTFVCDGRIALDLAVAALQQFEKSSIPHLGDDGQTRTLSACAGVALVKAHAPFYRSYDLAESLCASAKRARQASNEQLGGSSDSGCWIDWHVGSPRPSEGVEEVRVREYRAGKLTLRPYPLKALSSGSHSQETWNWLDEELLGPGADARTATQGFRGAESWAQSRHRVKQLRPLVAAEDKAGIKRQVDSWGAVDGRVKLPGGLGEDGFLGDRTPLLDAVELLDLHMRLEESL